jgi:hypothetical protein
MVEHGGSCMNLVKWENMKRLDNELTMDENVTSWER